MPNWTQEELTCPECGRVFKDMRGLKGHRQFKHGIRQSAQLPLEKQDLLVNESKLEQLLDARFAVITEQLDALSGEQPGALSGEQLEQLEQLQQQVKDLTERLDAAERKSIDDFGPREKAEFLIPWMRELSDADFMRLSVGTGHYVIPDPGVVEVVDPKALAAIAETFQELAPESVVQGKTDLPGYRYFETINLSVREK